VSEKRMNLVREHLDAFSARDWERYKKTLMPSVVYQEQGTGVRAEGLDKALQAVKTWTVAFPDMKGTITNLMHQEDMVIAEIRWEGKHDGLLKLPFGEFPASHKRGVLNAVELFHFEGDRIREVRHYFDSMSVLNQIGVQVPVQV